MKHEILLVDSERRSVRVLDVALRSAGYSVRIAGNGLDALEKLDAIPPDVVVTDSHLPKLDGYALLQKLRERPETAHIPGIVLMEASEDWGRWRALGSVERLPKPGFVRELVACVELLITRSARARLVSGASRSARVSGSTEDLAVVDLLQAVEMLRESAVLYLLRRAQQAEIQFRSGRVVDASVGRLRGERAIYAVLGWDDAAFELEFKPVDNHDIIDRSTATLLVEGMRRLDETASNLDQGRASPIPEVDHVRLLEEVGLRPSGEGPSSSERNGKGLTGGPVAGEVPSPAQAAAAHSTASPSSSNGVPKGERDEKPVAADEPAPRAQPPTAKSQPKMEAVDPLLASLEGELALFSEVARPDVARPGIALPSSRPWTREVDPGADLPLDDEPPISRVPRVVSRTAKRVVAASVAVAALICVTAGLRTLSVRRERLADDARRPTPIALSLPAQGSVAPSPEPDPVASASESPNVAPPPVAAGAGAPGETKADTDTREERSPPANAPAATAAASAGTTAAAAESPPPPPAATRDTVGEPVEPAAMPAAEHHAAIDTRVAPTSPSASGAGTGSPARASNPAALVKEAEQALLQGANARAVQLATEAVTTAPADAAGWLVLASAHRAMGEDDAARTDYRNCVAQAQTAGVTDCRILAGH